MTRISDAEEPYKVVVVILSRMIKEAIADAGDDRTPGWTGRRDAYRRVQVLLGCLSLEATGSEAIPAFNLENPPSWVDDAWEECFSGLTDNQEPTTFPTIDNAVMLAAAVAADIRDLDPKNIRITGTSDASYDEFGDGVYHEPTNSFEGIVVMFRTGEPGNWSETEFEAHISSEYLSRFAVAPGEPGGELR